MRSPITGCVRITLPLVGVERPGLVQDRVGDADLADVVQQRDGGELGELVAVEAEARADVDREVVDGVGVLAGVAVARLERRGERAHDRARRVRGLPALALEVAQDVEQRVVAGRQPVVGTAMRPVLSRHGSRPVRARRMGLERGFSTLPDHRQGRLPARPFRPGSWTLTEQPV